MNASSGQGARAAGAARAGRLALLILLALGLLNSIALRHAWKMLHFTDGGMRTAPPERLTRAQRVSVLFETRRDRSRRLDRGRAVRLR